MTHPTAASLPFKIHSPGAIVAGNNIAACNGRRVGALGVSEDPEWVTCKRCLKKKLSK